MPASTPARRSGSARCPAGGRSRSRGHSNSVEPGHPTRRAVETMSDSGEPVTVRVHPAISEIDPADWDACAGELNPTVSHTFLNAMEESRSVTARGGWAPQHLSITGPDGRVAGIVP